MPNADCGIDAQLPRRLTHAGLPGGSWEDLFNAADQFTWRHSLSVSDQSSGYINSRTEPLALIMRASSRVFFY